MPRTSTTAELIIAAVAILMVVAVAVTIVVVVIVVAILIVVTVAAVVIVVADICRHRVHWPDVFQRLVVRHWQLAQCRQSRLNVDISVIHFLQNHGADATDIPFADSAQYTAAIIRYIIKVQISNTQRLKRADLARLADWGLLLLLLL